MQYGDPKMPRKTKPVKSPSAAPPPTVPPGYENDLSGYGPVLFDGWCGEPVGKGEGATDEEALAQVLKQTEGR